MRSEPNPLLFAPRPTGSGPPSDSAGAGTSPLVVLVGLLGGVALGTIAGARRTQASSVTYLRSTNPSDLEVITAFANPALGSSVGYNAATVARIDHLPFVRSHEVVVGFDCIHGVHPHSEAGEKPVSVEGALAGEYTTQDSAHIVAGRYPDPHDPHEAVMNAQAAQEAGLHIGSVVRLPPAAPPTPTPC